MAAPEPRLGAWPLPAPLRCGANTLQEASGCTRGRVLVSWEWDQMKGSRNKPPQPCSVSEYPPRRLHDPSRTRARTHTHTHTHTQTCSQIHTRALRYTCTLPQTHAGINTCKQTGAHLYAHMHAETHAHSHTCTLANNVHTGTRAHQPPLSVFLRVGLKASETSLRLALCIRLPALAG